MQLPTVVPAAPGNCQLRTNNNPFIHGQRALLAALRDWITNGTEPPASLYPTLASGTLVPLSDIHYPYIPAVNFTLAGVTTQKFYLDRGPLFNVEDISGVMREPPIKREPPPSRVTFICSGASSANSLSLAIRHCSSNCDKSAADRRCSPLTRRLSARCASARSMLSPPSIR